MKFILLNILLIIFANWSFGQLTTSVSSAGNLVQNVLLGPGVTVSNIQYNGAASTIGSFTANGTNLGISSGIVMTTGTIINNGNGPQGPNNQSNSGFNNNAVGLPLLSNLVNGTQTYNAAVLQFDFIPYSDTVRFKYVFGSEEYPEFVGSTYNDVFGFFISGPGISGQQNIAKLPGGTPVTINNVNNGYGSTPASNPAYFVYNGTGSNSPYNSSPNYIQYDGFTKVLEAVSKVQCGQTYHLVIAIADAGDGIYDSGIFLEANSLQSKVPVEISSSLSFQAFPDPKEMAEGCVTATVNLTRFGNLTNSLSIPVNISGTATQLTDYTAIPSTVTFPPGQANIQFTFDALSDAVLEGIETIKLSFPISDPCGNVTPIVLDFTINDVQPVAVSVQSSTVLCPGDQMEMIAVPSGGTGPYTFIWNTGETTSSIFVSPTSTATYTVTIEDNCLHQTATANGTVTVPIYPPLALNQSPDIIEICPYIAHTLEVHPQGGAGNYSIQWSSNIQSLLGTDTLQDVLPSTTTIYTVIVHDQCGQSIAENINYVITSPPLELTMSPKVDICPNDSVIISVTATGGYGQYFYAWHNDNITTQNQWVNPAITTNYTVSVSDECQTFSVDGTTTVSVIEPIANFEISSTPVFNNIPISFNNLTQGGQAYYWTFGDGNDSYLVDPNNLYENYGNYVVTLVATNYLGCKDTISKTIFIEEEHYIYVPNTFTPDGNRFNNVFEAKTIGINQLEVFIYNRWGELIFTSTKIDFTWDGSYNKTPAKDDTYIYKIKYVSNSGFEETLVGHVNLIR
ncbi:MAG: choice-of-anchor L domain-containing protein [Flavobacteriia bacterium]|nr:choice-of-anchor L domain-containing protein [Flavobacteriia bacterium]